MEIEQEVEKIEFNVERDFNSTINAAFAFVKQNFKHFLLTLLYIVGPVLLVTALLNGFFAQQMFDFEGIMNGTHDSMAMFTPAYFLTILSTILSGMMLIGVTYEYMCLYEEKGAAGFEVVDVWNAFKRDFGQIASTFFGLLLVGIIIGAVAAIVMGLFAIMGTAGVVIMAILMIGGMLILMFPLAYVFTAVYLIRIRERLGFWESLTKARTMLKDNFWRTWVMVLVVYFIVSALSMVFMAPQMIIMFFVGFNSIQGGGVEDYSLMIIVFSTIGVFGATLVRSLFLIIIGFHYFSLNEQKQGVGLISQIDEIGNTNTDNEDITI